MSIYRHLVHSENGLNIHVGYDSQWDAYSLILRFRNFDMNGAAVSGSFFLEVKESTFTWKTWDSQLTCNGRPFMDNGEWHYSVSDSQNSGRSEAEKDQERWAEQTSDTATFKSLCDKYAQTYLTDENKRVAKVNCLIKQADSIEAKANRLRAEADLIRAKASAISA